MKRPSLPPTHAKRRNLRRAAFRYVGNHVWAVLLSLGMLAGQTAADQHLHLNDTAEATCVVCGHADPPAYVPEQMFAPDTLTVDHAESATGSQSTLAAQHTSFRPRAPPAI